MTNKHLKQNKLYGKYLCNDNSMFTSKSSVSLIHLIKKMINILNEHNIYDRCQIWFPYYAQLPSNISDKYITLINN